MAYVSRHGGVPTYPRLKGVGGTSGGLLLRKGETPPPPTYELSQPVMYITTEGGAAVTSKTTYVNCTYRIVNELGVGAELFNQPGRIRGRGNSTWMMPKKPFKVKLDNKVEVLGMPKSKDWALLANYIDPSKVRYAMANEISGRTGLPWAPRSVNLEVYLNGVYLGLYQFSESVEVDQNRVNIDELKATHTSGRNLTGGYILEVDTRFEENDEIGWRTRLNVPIIFDTPDGDISQQYTYAKNFTQACEDALFAEDFTDGAWRDLLDADSWADWYLLNELLCNNDSGFGASVKLTKPRDPASGPASKLHAGPAWDFDASCGITFFIPHPSTGWWTRVGATWVARMLEDPWFRDVLKHRWALLRSRLLAENDTIFDWLSAMENSVAGAVARDAQIWGAGSAPNIHTWLGVRISWIDAQLIYEQGVDVTPPATPTGFTTTAVNSTSVSFTWTDAGAAQGTGVVGYRIRQNGVIAAMTAYPYSDPLNSVTIANLTAGTQYLFTLECRDAIGNWSAATAALDITTSL